jgi:hypothetical protein
MSGAERIAGNAARPGPPLLGFRRRTGASLLEGEIAGKNKSVLEIRVQRRGALASWQSSSSCKRLAKSNELHPLYVTHKETKRGSKVSNIRQFRFGVFNIFNVDLNHRTSRLF